MLLKVNSLSYICRTFLWGYNTFTTVLTNRTPVQHVPPNTVHCFVDTIHDTPFVTWV